MQEADALNETEYDAEDSDAEEEQELNKDEFRINSQLVVRLQHGEACMYVNGHRFDQCVYPVVNSDNDEYFPDRESVDQEPLKVPRKATRAVDGFLWKDHGTLDHPGYIEGLEVTEKERFWGLCSALQAWAENDYDTKLLHVNLAFPLARALANAGDPAAKVVFEREVVARWKSDFEPVQTYLSHGFTLGLSSKPLVEIIVHGGPHHLIKDLIQRVDGRVLVEAWIGAKSKTQLSIIDTFQDLIRRLDPEFQVPLLEGCTSSVVGKALLRIIDTNRFSQGQITTLNENKRASKFLSISSIP